MIAGWVGGIAIAKNKLSQGNAIPVLGRDESRLKKLISDRRVQVGGAIAVTGAGAFALGKKYLDDQEKTPEEWKDFANKSDEVEGFLKNKRKEIKTKNNQSAPSQPKTNTNALGTRNEQQSNPAVAIVPANPPAKDKWRNKDLETVGGVNRKDLTPEENDHLTDLLDKRSGAVESLFGGLTENGRTITEELEVVTARVQEMEKKREEEKKIKQKAYNEQLSRRGKAKYEPYERDEVDDYLEKRGEKITVTEDEVDQWLKNFIIDGNNAKVTREETRRRIIANKKNQARVRMINDRLTDESYWKGTPFE